jgi:hypothetical protein
MRQFCQCLFGQRPSSLAPIKHGVWLALEFEDRALGHQIQNLNQEVGDFVLRRSDGLFTYQLAVVVDDAEQGITHVVRGEDLLSNTARQIYLQKVLHYQTQEFLHLTLVLDVFGDKLSKQTLANAIDTSTPAAALNALEQAANHLGLQEIAQQAHQSIGEFLSAATVAWTATWALRPIAGRRPVAGPRFAGLLQIRYGGYPHPQSGVATDPDEPVRQASCQGLPLESQHAKGRSGKVQIARDRLWLGKGVFVGQTQLKSSHGFTSFCSSSSPLRVFNYGRNRAN